MSGAACFVEMAGGPLGVPVLVMRAGSDSRVVAELAEGVDASVPLVFVPTGPYVCSSTDLGTLYRASMVRQRTVARVVLALGDSTVSSEIVSSFATSELPRLLHVTHDEVGAVCRTLLREAVEMLTLTDTVAAELRQAALAEDRFGFFVDFLEENGLRGADCCRRLLTASET